MAFFDRLNDFAKNIGDKTNDAIETSKLNSKINTEKTAIAENMKKIGEYYYSIYAQGGEVAPEVEGFCQSIVTHNENIVKAQAEIQGIKDENEAAAAARAAAMQQAKLEAEQAKAAAAARKAQQDTEIAAMQAGAMPTAAVSSVQMPQTEVAATVQAVPAGGMVCPGCGTEYEEGKKFCTNCGSKLEAKPVPVVEVPQERTCPGCGVVVADGMKFCNQCGTKLF